MEETAKTHSIQGQEVSFVSQTDLDNEGFLSLKPEKEKCEICFLVEFRYKCPGCNMKTCSLKCVNEHKALKKCDGKYHHEKFINLSAMTQKSMQKDLTYLNDVMQGSENIKKRLSLLKKNQEQLRFKLLKIYARKQHNVKVRLAPSIMTRHRENLSFYHTKSKKIYWTIELKFCSFMKRNLATGELEPQREEIRLLLDPQDETVSLFELVRNLKIDDPKVLWYLQEKFEDAKLLDNISCSRLYCYILDEHNPRERLTRRLDWFVPFKDGIKDVTIIEYPTLLIVSYKEFAQFEKMYKVTDPLLVVTPS